MKLHVFLRRNLRVVQFYPALRPLLGSASAVLFFGQALYWSDKTDNDSGWFWKTEEQWEEETSLSRREQETARRLLRQAGVLLEEFRGIPRKLWFRLDLERFEQLAETYFSDEKPNNNDIMHESAIIAWRIPPSLHPANAVLVRPRGRLDYSKKKQQRIQQQKTLLLLLIHRSKPPPFPHQRFAPPLPVCRKRSSETSCRCSKKSRPLSRYSWQPCSCCRAALRQGKWPTQGHTSGQPSGSNTRCLPGVMTSSRPCCCMTRMRPGSGGLDSTRGSRRGRSWNITADYWGSAV